MTNDDHFALQNLFSNHTHAVASDQWSPFARHIPMPFEPSISIMCIHILVLLYDNCHRPKMSRSLIHPTVRECKSHTVGAWAVGVVGLVECWVAPLLFDSPQISFLNYSFDFGFISAAGCKFKRSFSRLSKRFGFLRFKGNHLHFTFNMSNGSTRITLLNFGL